MQQESVNKWRIYKTGLLFDTVRRRQFHDFVSIQAVDTLNPGYPNA
jgi:hypothetical protein